jgi:hypothetical protein
MSEHWLQHAHGRIVAGDDELDVLADYGWVQLTDEEREALYRAEARLRAAYVPDDETAATLRSLLKRLHT